jgi:hypothetical protein
VRLTFETYTQRQLELDPVLQQLNELQRSELQQPTRFNGILYDASSLLPASLCPPSPRPPLSPSPQPSRQGRTSQKLPAKSEPPPDLYAIRHLDLDTGHYEADFSPGLSLV